MATPKSPSPQPSPVQGRGCEEVRPRSSSVQGRGGRGVEVIGAGLAGCEAALQCARLGVLVRLFEMRPEKMTEAHETGDVAELVCSNSLKSDEPENAHGLLKAELRVLGSALLECAERARVPGGKALVVDRRRFSQEVQKALDAAGVEVVRHEAVMLTRKQGTVPRSANVELGAGQSPFSPDFPSRRRGFQTPTDRPGPSNTAGNRDWEVAPTETEEEGEGEPAITVIATGPLTSQPMAEALQALLGTEHLFFYDAIAPIVAAESLDMSRVFEGSRYGAGDAEKSDVRCEMSDVRSEDVRKRTVSGYLNCPMSEEEYGRFVDALLAAELHPLHDFENPEGVHPQISQITQMSRQHLRTPQREPGTKNEEPGTFFEGCLPVEEIARRGRLALAFGPMKPVGLVDPRTGKRPFAVVQLRRENAEGSMYNLVGFQTRLKQGEQRRVFGLIPGLEHAGFLRFGSIHQNTFLDAPKVLLPTLQTRARPDLLVAGQLTGVEGYVESIGAGLVAGINAARLARGEEPAELPREMMVGSLLAYISASAKWGQSLEVAQGPANVQSPFCPENAGQSPAAMTRPQSGTVPVFPLPQSKAFQPMNANFGLLPPLEKRLRGRDKRRAMAERALAAASDFVSANR